MLENVLPAVGADPVLFQFAHADDHPVAGCFQGFHDLAGHLAGFGINIEIPAHVFQRCRSG